MAVLIATDFISALGDLAQTWQAMNNGETGLEMSGFSGLDEFPLGLVSGVAGDFGSSQRLFSLVDKGLANLTNLPANADLILATTKGAVDELNFPEGCDDLGQPWNLAKAIAEKYHINGRLRTVSAACASGTLAIIQARQMVEADPSRTVLVVGVDIMSKFVLAGFASLQGLAKRPCQPFDKERTGLSLGEGVGFALVCSEQYAQDHGLAILAIINGSGVACDATHITAPCRQASGLKKTIRQALLKWDADIGAINAHGTGTVYNDAMELKAFSELLPEVPFFSVKGAIGHCLGAAGVMEVAISVMALQKKQIPPTVGLEKPEVANLSTESRLLRNQAILSCNSGFGGINAAVLLTGY